VTELASDARDEHFGIVADQLRRGLVVPLLGAGANLCDRPEGANWQEGEYAPSGDELAQFLAGGAYRFPDRRLDLLRVSQWVSLVGQDVALKAMMHEVFSKEYKPTRLHTFLAELPGLLRKQGGKACGQLILSTNYDDVLERAFEKANERVDVVVYEKHKNAPQRFVHIKPDEARTREPITAPETYDEFDLADRSVILKIHGDVDADETRDTFVITEDHYIDYMAGTSVQKLIPASLVTAISRKNLLFLGYALRDWNLRVILRQIWAEQGTGTGGWSIQRAPGKLDEKFWARQGIEIHDMRLEDWVDGIREKLG